MTYLLPQSELVEKFNAAFYEAQQRRIPLEEEILETFDESYFTDIDAYETNDYLSDCFVDDAESGIASSFDYADLSESLENVFAQGGEFSNFFVPPPFAGEAGEKLPPISTINRTGNNPDFANFLRTMPPDSLDIFVTDEVSSARGDPHFYTVFTCLWLVRVKFEI